VRRHLETKSLSMHRLVQAVLKDEMDQHGQEQWAERTVRAVNHLFPFGSAVTWHLCQRYLPHAIVGAGYIERWKMAWYEAGRLLHYTASYLDDRAQYREAEPLYQRALAIYERVLGDDHSETLRTLKNYADLLKKMGREGEAAELEARVEAMRVKVQGSDKGN
jgi:tetratricopeptide (TPR) repeat protein